jgi:hypothetical protein
VTRLVDGYLYQWQEPDFVEIEVSEVRRKSDEWRGEMEIRTNRPDKPKSSYLKSTTHTLSVSQSRTQLAGALEKEYGLANGSRWSDYLEMACVLTVRSERKGAEFIKVGRLDRAQAPQFWLLKRNTPGGFLRVGHPTSIWADGSTGKSTLACLWAIAVYLGIELAGFTPCYRGPVIWLDWESDEWDIDDTIKCLRVGHGIEEEVEFDYRREVWPLTQTFRQVANQAAKESAALVVLDSVGYAIGGDGEKAGEVLEFIRAVRALNTSVLMIDHVRKGDTGGKAYGNAYKFNEVRLGFELSRHQADGEPTSVVGLRCRKANKGGWAPPLYLRVEFTEGSIHYQETDPPEEAVAADAKPKERIRHALRSASDLMNADEIMEAVNRVAEKYRWLKIGTVKARLSEMVKDGDVFTNAARGEARRYCLQTSREEGS